MSVLARAGGKPVLSATFPWPIWGDVERQALLEVVDSGHWGCLDGHQVRDFEVEYAQYHDAKHCICTSCGTTALQTALMAWGIAVGDEVIIPPYTFIATASAVLNVGAVPVFADIDPATYTLDAASAEEMITDKTRAIIAVHIGGSPADLRALGAVARSHGLLLLEDAAQAAGAMYGGRKVGAIGQLGCFSFQASKNLNCGEGGAILTDDDELAARCHSIINCGRPDAAFPFRVAGTNYRMTEFQAAMLRSQMGPFEEQCIHRDRNARFLDDGLGSVEGIVPARVDAATDRRGCHLYMFRYDEARFGGLSRDGFVSALGAEGVPCCCGYSPLYRNDLLVTDCARYPELFRGYARGRAYRGLSLPATETVCAESVWFFQQVLLGSAEEMELIVRAVRKVRDNQSELQGLAAIATGPKTPSI